MIEWNNAAFLFVSMMLAAHASRYGADGQAIDNSGRHSVTIEAHSLKAPHRHVNASAPIEVHNLKAPDEDLTASVPIPCPEALLHFPRAYQHGQKIVQNEFSSVSDGASLMRPATGVNWSPYERDSLKTFFDFVRSELKSQSEKQLTELFQSYFTEKFTLPASKNSATQMLSGLTCCYSNDSVVDPEGDWQKFWKEPQNRRKIRESWFGVIDELNTGVDPYDLNVIASKLGSHGAEFVRRAQLTYDSKIKGVGEYIDWWQLELEMAKGTSYSKYMVDFNRKDVESFTPPADSTQDPIITQFSNRVGVTGFYEDKWRRAFQKCPPRSRSGEPFTQHEVKVIQEVEARKAVDKRRDLEKRTIPEQDLEKTEREIAEHELLQKLSPNDDNFHDDNSELWLSDELGSYTLLNGELLPDDVEVWSAE